MFIVTTNEGGTGGTISQFINAANKNHIKISYASSLTSIGNYLPLGSMEKNNTPVNNQKVDVSATLIVNDIVERKVAIRGKNLVLGPISLKLSKLFDKFAKDTAKSYTVESHCTNCGTCAMVCPKNNITVSDKVTFASRCISCYGCTHNCPQNAIRVKGEKSKVRYRNKAVSLKEIIESNNQL